MNDQEAVDLVRVADPQLVDAIRKLGVEDCPNAVEMIAEALTYAAAVESDLVSVAMNAAGRVIYADRFAEADEAWVYSDEADLLRAIAERVAADLEAWKRTNRIDSMTVYSTDEDVVDCEIDDDEGEKVDPSPLNDYDPNWVLARTSNVDWEVCGWVDGGSHLDVSVDAADRRRIVERILWLLGAAS